MATSTQQPGEARLLVSACLLGNPVRYDGKAKPLQHSALERLHAEGRLIAFCPEVAGGLPVPRAPAEIIGNGGNAVLAGHATVATREGDDVSEYFIAGAKQALDLCLEHSVTVALLTEKSPSCGSGQIYDGGFSRNSIEGSGVTTALLRQHGIAVFSQFELQAALDYLASTQ